MKVKKIVLIFLTAIWIAVIWGHSMMNGESSSGESSFVGQILTPFFELFAGRGNVTHYFIRKVGHFSEYAVLGALASALLRAFDKIKLFALSYAFLCGLAVSVADETIQIFSDGRGPAVTDVLIDSAGMFAGMLVLTCVFLIAKAIKKGRAFAKARKI